MADKRIDQLIDAEDIHETDLFVLQQDEIAKKLSGKVLIDKFAAKLASDIPAIDDTLTQSGQAADAAETGLQIGQLKSDLGIKEVDITYKSGVPITGFYQHNSDDITESPYYKIYEYDVKGNKEYDYAILTVAADKNAYDFFIVKDSDNNTIINWGCSAGTCTLEGTYLTPENARKIIITDRYNHTPIFIDKSATNLDALDKEINDSKLYPWRRKKIVWFGTSIPAGTYNRGDKYVSYPDVVGELLHANVVNESVGSSAVARRNVNWIDSSNPYGFPNNFKESVRCLTNTLDIQNWLIEHWEDGKWTDGKYTSMTEEQKEEILSWSYERKLVEKHLGEGKRADLYVFDHGRNDHPNEGAYDYDTLKETYGEKNPYCYIGGMNFLIDLILKDNPKANIIQISHYESQQTPSIIEKQQKMCEIWSIDFLRLDKKLGWSQQTISTTGYWDDGIWVPSGGSEQDITILDANLCDGVHPHSDLSGDAINKIASILAGYLNSCKMQ